jgi:hypothetical protein
MMCYYLSLVVLNAGVVVWSEVEEVGSGTC